MASLADVVSTGQGVVQNLSVLARNLVAATLGASLGGTTMSPTVTIASAVATASLFVVAANSTRINIMFHSPVSAGADIYVVPSTMTAVIGQGLLVKPGSSVMIPSTCGWNAIATTGSQVLTIVEFF